MADIEKTYLKLTRINTGGGYGNTSPAMLFITLTYLICVLSVPLYQPQKLIWLAAYPVAVSEIEGIGYGKIFIKSLWILPLVFFIGIFNPFIDTAVAFRIGNISVSQGCISFISILIRGLLSFQSVLILVATTGFIDIFNTMRKFGCPSVLTTQLLLSYRYIYLIIDQAVIMKRAREARGYGRKSYPLKMWGQFVGQLLIRSSQRAVWIHRAMDARGFDGTMPTGHSLTWTSRTWVWLVVWCSVIICLRLIDFSSLIKHFVS